MISKRFIFFSVFIAAVIIILIVPTVSAEDIPSVTDLNNYANNMSPTSTESSTGPFITFDPIGNHTIGDVFFINGTTNLPVSENLTMEIVDFWWFFGRKTKSAPEHPGPDAYQSKSNIPVISEASATPGLNPWASRNRWFVNVTDIGKELNGAVYLVEVFSPSHLPCDTPGCANPDAFAFQVFALLPENNSTPSTTLQTIVQSPSLVQPTTSIVTVSPTKKVVPLPLVLPITVLVMMTILGSIYGKKRD